MKPIIKKNVKPLLEGLDKSKGLSAYGTLTEVYVLGILVFRKVIYTADNLGEGWLEPYSWINFR